MLQIDGDSHRKRTKNRAHNENTWNFKKLKMKYNEIHVSVVEMNEMK